jgi:hypothetical protein
MEKSIIDELPPTNKQKHKSVCYQNYVLLLIDGQKREMRCDDALMDKAPVANLLLSIPITTNWCWLSGKCFAHNGL